MNPGYSIPSASAATEGPLHHFFGYYEKCPWDVSGKYLLGLQVDCVHRPPQEGDVARVGYVDLGNGSKWHNLGETRTWNLQQGCMLQWLGESEDNPLVLFNDLRDGRFVSVVSDLNGREQRVISRPVYGLSKDGRWGLSLNFSRLQNLRPGYGYPGVDDPWIAVYAPTDDGIYSVDMENGDSRLILSVADIACINPQSSMEGATHWLNHLQFSPDGHRFAFLHRWMKKEPDSGYSKNGTVPLDKRSQQVKTRLWRLARKTVYALKRTPVGSVIQSLQDRFWRPQQPFCTRMFTANRDGTDLFCVADTGVVSHFDWVNPREILAWATQPQVGDRFIQYSDRTSMRRVIGENVLTEDGHCTLSPDGKWILTDSGPDAHDISRLILFDRELGVRHDICEVYSPPELRGECRCDLHPRWDRTGSQICFDSAHEGSRQMYTIDVRRWVERGAGGSK